MQNDIYVSVTIDVENPQTPLFEKRFLDNRIWSNGYGIEKIIEILDKYRTKGTFFTNVYEYPIWGKGEIERIVKYIHENGHDVELHTHPIWIDEKRRENMFQFPLSEQESIIRWGADFIDKHTGRKPVCHRAGAYGFNINTLNACRENKIEVDSSNFYGHPNCRCILTKNEPLSKYGIMEMPVTFFTSGQNIVKTDIDWMSVQQFQMLIEKAKEVSKPTFINLFLHSYSLTKTDDNFLSFKPDHDTIDKLEQCLKILQSDTRCTVKTLSDCANTVASTKNTLSKTDIHNNFKIKENTKEIVFVKTNPQLRIFKEALALKKIGRYKLTLLATRYDKTLFKDVFDNIIPFKDKAELVQIVKGMKPYIFHAHATPNTIPAIVIENTRVPVVYDPYDFAGLRYGGIQALQEEERVAERFCLENANGIVNKFSDEALEYYRSCGYSISAPVLHYEDYCAEEFTVPLATKPQIPREWNIVNVGAIAPANLPRERYGHQQFHNLARLLGDHCVHLHIYPNPYQYGSDFFKCYEQLAEEVSCFKWHVPVHPFSLSPEICKYHWGTFILAEPVRNNKQSNLGIGNKIASYLEAGLPILTTDWNGYVAKFVNEMGIGISIENWSQIHLLQGFLNDGYHKVYNNLDEVRRFYSISNNKDRIATFYRDVCSN